MEAEETFFATVTAGFKAIGGNRNLRLIAALYMAQTVVAGASSVYEVTIALELLEMSESGVGLLDSVLGIGGLIGGVVAMVLTRRQRLATDFGIGVVLWSAPLLLIVAVPRLGADAARHVPHRAGQLDRRHQRLHDHPARRAARGDGAGVRRPRERRHRRHGVRRARSCRC